VRHLFLTTRNKATENASQLDLTVEVINPSGGSDVVFVCEHASHFIPEEFGRLGLPETLLESHIAWDPGAFSIAQELSAAFDAPLVAQKVSRLLYDCNRMPGMQSAIPSKSESFEIPGNSGLTDAQRQERVDRFYTPFCNALAACLDAKINGGGMPIIVTIHSFTPIFLGKARQVEIGVLHDADVRLASILAPLMRAGGEYDVQINGPYGPKDDVTHTLIEHGIFLGCLNVMLEVRKDFIISQASQIKMANWLATHLKQAITIAGKKLGQASSAR
jgi:predicted N-formylglutamate amidohydrolase